MELFDYVAVDFETATSNYNSACSIGIAAVKNGEIVETFHSFIKPPGLKFDPATIAIHGITPDMVADSPTLDELWNKISKYFHSHLVVAHNAYFDMSVLKNSFPSSDHIIPNFKYVDSMSIARNFVDGSKSLSNCAEYLDIELSDHHDALCDAIVCAKIVQACLDLSGAANIGQFCFASENVKIHCFKELAQAKSASFQAFKHSSVSPRDITPTQNRMDRNHPLYQKNIVFTGELQISRREAMQMAADVGAVLKSSVSRKTDYLVVGKQDTSLVGEDGMSTKEERAHELNNSLEANIRIIGETEFIELVENRIEFDDFETQDEDSSEDPSEGPSEEELLYLNSIFPKLEEAVAKQGADTKLLRIRYNKDNTAVVLGNFIIFCLRIRKRLHYTYISKIFSDLIPSHAPKKVMNSNSNYANYIRVMINEKHPIDSYTDFLIQISGETVNRYPADWDCCSRYQQCSDAKECVHPNKTLALSCGYRKILKTGRIFYGKNRNVD